MELGKIEKILSPPMDFSGIARDLAEAREAIIPRKWKHNFSGAENEN